MANDNIVAGLFGLPSPFDVQQRQNESNRQYAASLAQADPFVAAKMSLGQAGAGLGQLGAGMMGMVNPEVEAAKQRETIMARGGTDLSTPEGLFAKAKQFADAGDQQTALKLTLLGRQAQTEQSKQALEAAHAKFYEQGGAAGGQSQLSAKQAIAYNNALKYYLDLNYSPEQARQLATQEAEKVGEFFNKSQVATQPAISQTQTATLPDQSQMTKEDILTIRQDALANGDTNTVQRIDAMLRSISIPQTTKAQVAGAIQLEKTRAENTPDILRAGAIAKSSGKEIGEATGKATERLPSIVDDLNNLGIAGDIIKNHPGLERATGVQAYIPSYPGGPASQAEGLIEEYKNSIKKIGLELVRQGGSIGQMTEREWPIVEGMVANIDTKKGKEFVQSQIDKVDLKISQIYRNTKNMASGNFEPANASKNEMSALPPPSQLTGKIVRDTITGNRYKSNGTNWVKQ